MIMLNPVTSAISILTKFSELLMFLVLQHSTEYFIMNLPKLLCPRPQIIASTQKKYLRLEKITLLKQQICQFEKESFWSDCIHQDIWQNVNCDTGFSRKIDKIWDISKGFL